MKIISMSIDKIIPYENNPRLNFRAISIVADSIKEFGFKNPIVLDKDNIIINGHTRYEASKELNLKKVPVIVASDLTDAQVKAFRIMDNKSSEFSGWDYEKLVEELKDITGDELDINLTGFNDIEINDLLAEVIQKEEEEQKKDVKPEMEFSPELLEEHNYVVLYFDNALDWNTAKDVLGLKVVHAFKSKKSYEKKGLGRVIRGADVINRLKSESDF